MKTMVKSRPDRLEELERVVRRGAEAFVTVGRALKEIQADELYQEAGFQTWTDYLNQRVHDVFGIERTHAYNLITCATIREKLPEKSSSTAVDENGWSQVAIREFARLAPVSEGHEQRRDLRELRKQDVARVAKAAEAEAERQGKRVTQGIVRKCVDKELGINRAADARFRNEQERKKWARLDRQNEREAEQREAAEEAGATTDLDMHLRVRVRMLEDDLANLRPVPADAWRVLEENDPELVGQLATAAEQLAAFLRQAGSEVSLRSLPAR